MEKIVATLVLFVLSYLPTAAFAGGQLYEDLKSDVRAEMSESISDSAPSISSFDNISEQTAWLVAGDAAIKKYVKNPDVRYSLLKTIHYEAERAGLEPALVMGIIQVESGFKKYSVSSVGARGYMQVMPFWVAMIGNPRQDLFHMRTNIRYGCVILRHYLTIENGNLFMALGRYNGSRGRSQYPDAVMAAAARFKKDNL